MRCIPWLYLLDNQWRYMRFRSKCKIRLRPKIWSTACTLLLVFPTGWRPTNLVLGVILMVAVVCIADCVACMAAPTDDVGVIYTGCSLGKCPNRKKRDFSAMRDYFSHQILIDYLARLSSCCIYLCRNDGNANFENDFHNWKKSLRSRSRLKSVARTFVVLNVP